MSRNLIATVGSNPLPVVIVTQCLKPPKLWLLYTKSTAKVRKQIEDLLRQKLDGLEIVSVEMGEGRSHREATEELASKANEWVGADLNYTAGKKQMSVVVHELWRKKNPEQGEGPDACYLDSDGILYWDNGQKDEPRVELTLQEIARLHFDEDSKASNDHKDEHLLSLSGIIRKIVCDLGIDNYLSTLPPVYGKKGSFQSKSVEIQYVDYNAATDKNFANEKPWTTTIWNLDPKFRLGEHAQWDDVTRLVFPEKKLNKALRLETFKFLATEWIEIWLADFLEGVGLFREVAQSFKLASGSKEFELDAVALKGSRIYTFSCTVDQTNALVKSKALEAHHRTQRIGGDHAAFAVFSLIEDPKHVFDAIKEERWHGHNRARIFGIEHLRDADKFRRELEEWLRH